MWCVVTPYYSGIINWCNWSLRNGSQTEVSACLSTNLCIHNNDQPKAIELITILWPTILFTRPSMSFHADRFLIVFYYLVVIDWCNSSLRNDNQGTNFTVWCVFTNGLLLPPTIPLTIRTSLCYILYYKILGFRSMQSLICPGILQTNFYLKMTSYLFTDM